MESQDPEKQSNKAKPANTIPIRVNKSTARLLKSIVTKCNRKSHGRKVKQDDVISKALQDIGESQIEEIRSATLSSQDHLEIEFKKYCQQNGAISKDEFLKLLLSKAIPQVSETLKEPSQ